MKRYVLGKGPQDWALIWITESGNINHTEYFGWDTARSLHRDLCGLLGYEHQGDTMELQRDQIRRLEIQVKKLKTRLRKRVR